MYKINRMKRIILFVLLVFITNVAFSQKMGETYLQSKEFKKTIKALSKFTKKKVVGYITVTSYDVKEFYVIYLEKGEQKRMLVDTLSRKFPKCATNRTVNLDDN